MNRRPFSRLFGSIVATAALFVASLASPAAAQTLLRDAEIEEFLDDYSRPILEVAGIPPDRIEILLIGDPTFNAFAGGRIMGFHTGFLTLSQTPNEIEAVIAHEVGHIAGGHTARSDEAIAAATRPMLLSLLLAAGAVAAGAPEAGIGLLGLGQNIGLANYLQYSRSQESAADQAGLIYLERLGKSGKGAMDVWSRMRNSQIIRGGRVNPYMQTHPLANARATALQTRVEASPYYHVRDSEAEILRLRMIQAKIKGFLQEPQQTMREFPASDTSAPARYARAVAYYRDARIEKGLSEVNSLITENAQNPYFHELKGQMLFEFGRVADAIAPHAESVRLAPDEPLLRLNLGRALLGSEDRAGAEKAIRELKAALLLEPNNSFAWFELSRAYGLLENRPMAYLATAESRYHRGAKGEAALFAQRALSGLSRGTPEYRQAADIIYAVSGQAAGGSRARRAPAPRRVPPPPAPSSEDAPPEQAPPDTTGSGTPEPASAPPPDVPDPPARNQPQQETSQDVQEPASEEDASGAPDAGNQPSEEKGAPDEAAGGGARDKSPEDPDPAAPDAAPQIAPTPEPPEDAVDVPDPEAKPKVGT